MSMPQEFRDINFSYKGQNYMFDLLTKQDASQSPLYIRGRTYSIAADKEDIPIIQEVLRAIPLDTVVSKKDLIQHIILLVSSSSFTIKAQQLGVKTLIPPKNLSLEEAAALKQSNQMNAVFARSLKSQFADRELLHPFGQREVVILVGTSTAGKSSVIEAYKSIRSEVAEAGIDKSIRTLIIQQIRQQYPEELRLLEATLVPSKDKVAILDAIFEPDTPSRYIKDLDPQKKLESQVAAKTIQKGVNIKIEQDAIESLLLEDIIKNASEGKQTILDVLEIDGIYQKCINEHFQVPTRVALVYCPFHVLSERMESRNRMAMEPENPKPSEKRMGTFPLFQYADLFGPKKNDDDFVIEILKRDVVIADFKKNFKDQIEQEKSDEKGFAEWINRLREKHGSDLSEDEVIEKESVSYMNKLLGKLGFTSETVESVEITPRKKKYHYFLDSSQLSAQESAETLHKDERTLYLI